MSLLTNALKQLAEDIDTGNSNITEEQEMEVLDSLNRILNPKNKLSKYQAINRLGISRATFDNYVRDGLIPPGKKEQGFKELFWETGDIMESLENLKRKGYIKKKRK